MRVAADQPDLKLLTLSSNSVFHVRVSKADPPGLRFDRYATNTYDTIKRTDVTAGVAIFNKLPPDERNQASRYAGNHRAASYLAAFLNHCANALAPTLSSTEKELPWFGGQGFGLTSKQRKAVEALGMEQAAAHYRAHGWTVDPRGKRFDLLLTKPSGEKRFVEVKASTGKLETIIVTQGEVTFACENPNLIDLFLLEGVTVTGNRASGGKARFMPWNCSRDRATPTHYRYRLGPTK